MAASMNCLEMNDESNNYGILFFKSKEPKGSLIFMASFLVYFELSQDIPSLLLLISIVIIFPSIFFPPIFFFISTVILQSLVFSYR
jgi:hypothetical protein